MSFSALPPPELTSRSVASKGETLLTLLALIGAAAGVTSKPLFADWEGVGGRGDLSPVSMQKRK